MFLFRHADKKNELSTDPELNPTGHVKAKMLSQWVSQGTLSKPSTLWSSPKKRAIQTLLPLAKSLQMSLQESKLLLESQAGESELHLQTRIETFLEKIALQKEKLHFVCSHYDWAIEFCTLALGASEANQHAFCQHWRPCQYIEFEMQFDENGSKWKGRILSHGVVQ